MPPAFTGDRGSRAIISFAAAAGDMNSWPVSMPGSAPAASINLIVIISAVSCLRSLNVITPADAEAESVPLSPVPPYAPGAAISLVLLSVVTKFSKVS